MPESAFSRGEIWAIVVAGGDGRRFGSQKQFLDLMGINVLERSVSLARAVADHVVAVVPHSAVNDKNRHGGADIVVAGGIDRSASVREGLAVVADSALVIIVHDAARPLASPELFSQVVASLGEGVDGVVPGIAVVDTVKRVSEGFVLETLDRNSLIAVQTPQAFRADVLRAAHASGASATDDAALVEVNGGVIAVVEGDVRNIKLTEPSDVDIALSYILESPQEDAL
ncbi:MAG TPA: IspD/TarI family cytidylyltransferase [Acidimicrobiales bacterium]|nr:IspD/TarI family cytidylyltransferase [Acidimicrobiales bacterium]